MKLNWSEEIRESIRQRINEFEREGEYKDAMEILSKKMGLEKAFLLLT